MSNRANMVVVENGEWTLHKGYSVGGRILDVVAFGPEYAVRYIRAHDESETAWIEPASADGGVIVDLDRRRMLFFGEELAVTMNERRAMLDLLGRMWPGYEVGWAYGGTDEFVDYVGSERHWERGLSGVKFHRVCNQSDVCHLVSVVRPEHGLRMKALTWGYSAAWLGPSMVDTLPYKGVARMRRTRIPESGVHVDVDKHSVGVWTTSESRGLFDLKAERWPGWQTECWDDRYEEQVARCDGALRVPSLDLVSGVATVRHWLHQRVFRACEDKPPAVRADWTKTRDPAAVKRDWYDYDDCDDCDDCDDYDYYDYYDYYRADSPFRPTRDDWNRFATACLDQRLLYTKSA